MFLNLQNLSTAEEVNNALKESSLNSMKGIIKYGDEPLVSSDYAGTNESQAIMQVPMNHQL